MAAIGIELDPDQLVLTRGRDFKWHFENLDENDQPIPFPAGDLYFELQTRGEHNAKLRVTTLRANGGSYTLGGSSTIPFDDESTDIRPKLEALPSIGAGNVKISGHYYPQWILTVSLSGVAAPTLPRNVQRALETAVSNVLDGLEFLGAGRYDLESEYAPPTWTFTVTDRTGYNEKEFLGYVVDIISTVVQNAIRAIGGVLNNSTVSVAQYFTPKRVFSVEFVGALSDRPVPPLVAVSSLTGRFPEVVVEQLRPGKEPLTLWHFNINGALADIKIESEEADKVQERTRWQLVFLPDGEPAGGEPIARGRVWEQE
ncbi:LtfC-like domain-containing protein [Mycobacteroides salmoniphilum]|uniref:LtfC-like domain-containing protein n=1 Tax=Mycobacteroides salmoniphilum TaxID=404941 RepID=UPI0009940064|nr:hypothetical protein [Mycobacteroides salmoniphilum]